MSYFNKITQTSALASLPIYADTGAPHPLVCTYCVSVTKWCVTKLRVRAEQTGRFEWSDVAPQEP